MRKGEKRYLGLVGIQGHHRPLVVVRDMPQADLLVLLGKRLLLVLQGMLLIVLLVLRGMMMILGLLDRLLVVLLVLQGMLQAVLQGLLGTLLVVKGDIPMHLLRCCVSGTNQ